MSGPSPTPNPQHPTPVCSHCGLPISGAGFSTDGDSCFCCRGCWLVHRIVAAKGEEGVASWVTLRLGVGAFLAMYVMMISMVLYVEPTGELGASAVRGLRWSLLVFSTPAVAVLGATFFLGSLKDLLRGRVSTDALIATGSAAAYGVSAVHVIRNAGFIYFDTATMLLVIVTLGRLMEVTARTRTFRAIRDMLPTGSPTARLLRDGVETEVPIADVRPGDTMVVRQGERVPADGRVVSGDCLVREAAFTGEFRPRTCAIGDHVVGGSDLCRGAIEVEVTAVGSDSLAGRIEGMVREAQGRRAPVERLVERVASVFVPVVWFAALGAACYWGVLRGDAGRGVLSGLAVLVVACPCALGLTTSLATCLAIGRAARAGVLIRSGEVLERLPKVDCVFFDKTGTLTDGVAPASTYINWEPGAPVVHELDPPRLEARETVESLKAIGIRVVLISGDRHEAAARLALELGIEEVHARCGPEEKIELVRNARKRGDVVAMVGDGINDAPALAAADIGIAIGSGTDLAREASDVTLLGDDLSRIPWSLGLVRLTYRIIRRNLAWAFGYNSVAIILASLGLLHPLVAALAMLASSLTVIGNSMRVNGEGRKGRESLSRKPES